MAKTLTYAILTFCFLIVLTCHYTPLVDPVARGDAAHYQAMANGLIVPQPFVDRITIPTIIMWLSNHIDISTWTYGKIDNVDAWYFVWTFLCLWGTVMLVRASLMRFKKSEDSASLAGFLYLSTFWLTGYQLSNFWLQDPFVNLCIWTGIYLWTYSWWYGMLGLGMAMAVKGGVLGYNWAVISMACGFVPDLPSLFFAFGFLWLFIGLADKRLLAILAIFFVVGRIVTADVARACVTVFAFPILLGVTRLVDGYRVGPIGIAIILAVHIWQQATWLFSP